jgi:membrane-bound lytic murein transglycosylase MltF
MNEGGNANDDVTSETDCSDGPDPARRIARLVPSPQPEPAPPVSARTPLRTQFAGRFTGDFDAMLDRRLIRLVAPYSPTLFFKDKGTIYGTAANGAQLFERWINKTFALGARPLTVPLTPVSRDKLFDALLAGDGDIAAGDLTITEELRKKVAFSVPVIGNVREIVITREDVPELDGVEALSGREVAVGRSTSYYESLTKLNERLTSQSKPPVTVTIVPDTLEVADLMEMTAAGLLPATVGDDWVAGLWVQIIKGLRLHSKAPLREGAEIGWAVRPDNPKLLATLNRAIAEITGNVNRWSDDTRSYLLELKQLHTATQGADMQRFRDTVETFRNYAGQYRFDTLMLVAQGYQESNLDQRTVSRVGAVGLMQIMPQTGRELGVGDIHKPDPNVHAGAKYMAQLMDDYFNDAVLDDQNRNLFAFAAYNAGPGKIQSLRREAQAEKLDPNLWFNNVERVAAARVGQEPVRYVRNIYKYYVAYKLIEESDAAKKPRSPEPRRSRVRRVHPHRHNPRSRTDPVAPPSALLDG